MVKVLNMAGSEVGEVELNASIFGITPNMHVVHEVVKNHLANCRQGTQSALTRAEVSGGGRKPWRQKGPGRARQGSTRAPQWTHGGVALGPKPRDYRYSLNRKVKRLAVRSALSSKVSANEMVVLSALTVEDYKTKTIVNMLSALGADKKVLIVTDGVDQKVVKSAANIPGVKTAIVGSLNVYDMLNCDKIVIVKSAVEKLQEVYA